jgi:predicted negative regulator of RcsB-dependent stress response
MLKPKRKITKQELKKDPLLEFINDAQQWISERKKLIYQVVFGVVAVVAVVYFVSNSRSNNSSTASAMLGKALLSQDMGDIENAKFELQNLVDEFSGTSAGDQGTFFLGKMEYDERNYDEAVKYLSDFADNGENAELLSSSYKMLADISLINEDLIGAERFLDKGFKTAENTVYENEMALLYANQLFTNGKSEKALDIVEGILEQEDILFSIQKMAEELKGKIES